MVVRARTPGARDGEDWLSSGDVASVGPKVRMGRSRPSVRQTIPPARRGSERLPPNKAPRETAVEVASAAAVACCFAWSTSPAVGGSSPFRAWASSTQDRSGPTSGFTSVCLQDTCCPADGRPCLTGPNTVGRWGLEQPRCSRSRELREETCRRFLVARGTIVWLSATGQWVALLLILRPQWRMCRNG
jgi:hypothetical protein